MTRELNERVCIELMSDKLPLFIPCQNQKGQAGNGRDRWVPRPFDGLMTGASMDPHCVLGPHQLRRSAKPLPQPIYDMYYSLGVALGSTFRSGNAWSLSLPQMLWKWLLGDEISHADLLEIDIFSYQLLQQIGTHQRRRRRSAGSPSEPLTADDIALQALLSDLTFTVSGADERHYELVPGGAEIRVTLDNFDHFCSLLRFYRLNEFVRQFEAIRAGFVTVAPMRYCRMMTPQELETRVCGVAQVDVATLKLNTDSSDFYTDEDQQVIDWFWQMLENEFTDEQRSQFLIFVYGRSRLSASNTNWDTRFSINKLFETDTFPIGHTCFFSSVHGCVELIRLILSSCRVDLPSYTSLEVMTQKVSFAIANCNTIDADGGLVEEE